MNSRLLQPNQSFPPQAWPGEADAAQFDFSNVPTSGESPRWEDPVTPAQTWPLEEESAFPPPPVTRAPSETMPSLTPPETETGATADVSPTAVPATVPAAVPALPDSQTAPAAIPDTSPASSTPANLAPEAAPAPIDPPPAAVEPALAPPASSDAAGDVAPPPTVPMPESRSHPEEIS